VTSITTNVAIGATVAVGGTGTDVAVGATVDVGGTGAVVEVAAAATGFGVLVVWSASPHATALKNSVKRIEMAAI